MLKKIVITGIMSRAVFLFFLFLVLEHGQAESFRVRLVFISEISSWSFRTRLAGLAGILLGFVFSAARGGGEKEVGWMSSNLSSIDSSESSESSESKVSIILSILLIFSRQVLRMVCNNPWEYILFSLYPYCRSLPRILKYIQTC